MVFASCSSGPAPEGSSARGKDSNVGKIPVEKKAVVRFADGSLDEYTESEYDPSDITLLSQTRFSASGGLMDQIEFTYNEEKQVITTKMTKDDENKLKSRIINEYDESVTPPRLIVETVVNKASKPVSVNRYTYNTKGGVVSRIIANGINIPLAETVYTYDESEDLIIASRTVNAHNTLISSSKNEYDRDGHLTNQVIYNKDGVATRKISTVWQNGRAIEIIQTSGDGKPQLKVTNEYGESGELVKKTIENFLGNSVQVMEFEYEFLRSRGRT
jgi:hypothetical protein